MRLCSLIIIILPGTFTRVLYSNTFFGYLYMSEYFHFMLLSTSLHLLSPPGVSACIFYMSAANQSHVCVHINDSSVSFIPSLTADSSLLLTSSDFSTNHLCWKQQAWPSVGHFCSWFSLWSTKVWPDELVPVFIVSITVLTVKEPIQLILLETNSLFVSHQRPRTAVLRVYLLPDTLLLCTFTAHTLLLCTFTADTLH